MKLMFLSLFVIVFGVILFRTKNIKKVRINIAPVEPAGIDTDAAAKKLSEAVKIKTISPVTHSNHKEFLKFHNFLETAFPYVHKLLEREIINSYSLLYKWPGTEPNLAPVGLIAHFDVIPIESGTEADWKYEPFSGEISNGFIWGRGTLDMKGPLMAILEAVERLLKNGYTPQSTIYLAFGHDEETGGMQGAAQIAAYLKSRNVTFSFTLDEGKAVWDKDLSPTDTPLGMIGIAEKGYLTLELIAEGPGGHPALAPFNTPVLTLSRILTELQKRPMSARLIEPIDLFLKATVHSLSPIKKILYSNKWLFKSLLLFLMGKSENTNAMIRTTSAPTMIRSGIRENVIPKRASLFINFRILPGDSIQHIINTVSNVIKDSPVTLKICKSIISEPSGISSTDSRGFYSIRRTVAEIFPEADISPGLVLGATDSRHYAKTSEGCYHFAPIILGAGDSERIHGTNERISIKNYGRAIQFYIQLIKNAAF